MRFIYFKTIFLSFLLMSMCLCARVLYVCVFFFFTFNVSVFLCECLCSLLGKSISQSVRNVFRMLSKMRDVFITKESEKQKKRIKQILAHCSKTHNLIFSQFFVFGKH